MIYTFVMNINIVCVGGIKEKFFTEAINEYKKRLSRFCKLNIIEVDEETKFFGEKKILAEGKAILAKCSGLVVALDGAGKQLSSPEIADFLKEKMLFGASEITFVVGGSNGLSSEVKNRAELCLSFGKITFPHQLFRVVLLEQIYRAFSIIKDMPYHK